MVLPNLARKYSTGIERIQIKKEGESAPQAHRPYHCVQQRDVPAANNRAGRALRPSVIARKVSFGVQSHAGAKTPRNPHEPHLNARKVVLQLN